MPKVNLIMNDFTAGEVTPYLYGRTNIPKYPSACSLLENVIIRASGAAVRRPGLRFVYNAGEGITSRLVSFSIWRTDTSPSKLQGYVLEIRSDGKIRFYTEGSIILSSGNPYEISHTFTTTTLDRIRYAQYNNTLYLVHPDVKPQKITRTSDTSWTISDVSFTMSTPHWDSSTGYPSAICFFEQRGVWASTKTEPTKIVFSKNGDPAYLETGTAADDAFSFKMAAATTPILHMVSAKAVTALTYDKEFTIQGSNDEALKPTNFQIKMRSQTGCNKAMPLAINEEIAYVSKHGTKTYTFGYEYTADSYVNADASIVADHLAGYGILDMVRTTEPQPINWMLLQNGGIATSTYDKAQQINAWARQLTSGLFKSLCMIPAGTYDQVWVSVQRVIGTKTYTYIEYFDWSIHTDSAVTATSASATDTWSGLGHLDGKLIDVKADGIVMPQETPTAGAIVLPREANALEAGLHYDSTIIDLPPEFPTGTGSAQNRAVSVSKCTVRLHESLGLTINGQVVPFRKFGEDAFEAIVPFTGDKGISTIGWDDGVVTIKQTQPLPMNVLAIIKEVTVN